MKVQNVVILWKMGPQNSLAKIEIIKIMAWVYIKIQSTYTISEKDLQNPNPAKI